jgi:hypothetical protein
LEKNITELGKILSIHKRGLGSSRTAEPAGGERGRRRII